MGFRVLIVRAALTLYLSVCAQCTIAPALAATTSSEPIRTTPSSISISVASGLTASVTLRLRKAGNDTHQYYIAANQPWISTTPARGTIQTIAGEMDALVVRIKTDGLALGSYSGIIYLLQSAPDGSLYVVRVPTALRVVAAPVAPPPPTPAPPPPPPVATGPTAIVVTPDSLSLTVIAGNTATGTLTLKKGGTDVRTYYISANNAWLWLEPPCGSTQTITTETHTLIVTVHTDGMAPGTYNGVVYLVESGINGYSNLIRVPVALTITPAGSTTPPPPTATPPPPPAPTTTSVTVTWYANTEADLAGYRLYVGTRSGVYTYVGPIDVPAPALSYTLKNVATGATYYFALSAFDKVGQESGKSAEMVKVIP